MKSKLVNRLQVRTALAGLGHEPLSDMAVSNFVAEGMPKAARGQYDLVECLVWYIGRLRTANQKRTQDDPDQDLPSLDKVERRLKKAKAESEEMTLAERRKELMPVHLHKETLTHLVQVTKQRFLNMPARLAQKLEGCTTAEIKALLSGSIRDALSELSRKELPIGQPAPTRKVSSENAGGGLPRKKRSASYQRVR